MKKMNGNIVAGLACAVIISAIAGISFCVKHMFNKDFFE